MVLGRRRFSDDGVCAYILYPAVSFKYEQGQISGRKNETERRLHRIAVRRRHRRPRPTPRRSEGAVRCSGATNRAAPAVSVSGTSPQRCDRTRTPGMHRPPRSLHEETAQRRQGAVCETRPDRLGSALLHQRHLDDSRLLGRLREEPRRNRSTGRPDLHGRNHGC